MTWETVIGLEVHAQLSTCSKLFSGANTQYGAAPNTQTSFIDAGLPGTLPVLNQKAVQLAIQFGLAINAHIQDLSYFERKNYFYPDLPKGYQISQFRRPIVSQGYLDIVYDTDKQKRVIIDRAHLEEDAGKLSHDNYQQCTAVDLNRAGTPLLEIVTAPCLSSAEEAVAYLKALHQTLRFLHICDGNMQEGSFRCDVNLSIRRQGDKRLGTRTELKNLNSFRFIEKAIHYEIQRHQDALESGEQLVQETRLYCPDTNTTQVMREKESETDYRYFTDPDLLPILITEEMLQKVKENMPELPMVIKQRLSEQDELPVDDIEFLLTSPAHVRYYNDLKHAATVPSKLILNWLKGPYSALLNERQMTFDNSPISANRLADVLDKLDRNEISAKMAKQIVTALFSKDQDIEAIIAAEGYQLMTNHRELETMVRDLIEKHPQQAAEYRAGKEKLLAFFIGQIMKATRGQAQPEQVEQLLKQSLVPRQ